ncbi:MAG: hypothetical protein Kow00117_16900 [Phototrophicales bacterium]
MEALRQAFEAIIAACDTLLKSSLTEQQRGDVLAMRQAVQDISKHVDSAAAQLPKPPTNLVATVRSPLTILIGYAEVLLDRTTLDDTQRHHVATILREARPLLSQIENAFGLDQDRTEPLA